MAASTLRPRYPKRARTVQKDALAAAVLLVLTLLLHPAQAQVPDAFVQNQTVTTSRTFSGQSVTVGPNVTVTASGQAVFETESYVAVRPVFSVMQGGTLSIVIGISSGPASEVWPGDTNGDNAVNGADVLPLGLHFGKTGPARPAGEQGCTFQGFSVADWPDPPATHADANGDGTVNGGDILCVGLNFGRTHTGAAAGPAGKAGAEALSGRLVLHLTPETAGTVQAEILAEDVQDLLGTAFTLVFPAEAFEVTAVEQGAWPGPDVLWHDQVDGGVVNIGLTRKASAGGISGTGPVAHIQLRKRSPDADPALVGLQAAVGTSARGAQGRLGVEVRQAHAALPESFVLHGNFPNPFNPSTTIVFDLPEAAQVTVEVHDVLGRLVMALPAQTLAAGAQHAITLDASLLSSGTYLYRVIAEMATQRRVRTGRLLLLK